VETNTSSRDRILYWCAIALFVIGVLFIKHDAFADEPVVTKIPGTEWTRVSHPADTTLFESYILERDAGREWCKVSITKNRSLELMAKKVYVAPPKQLLSSIFVVGNIKTKAVVTYTDKTAWNLVCSEAAFSLPQNVQLFFFGFGGIGESPPIYIEKPVIEIPFDMNNQVGE
jgi:hypothetical protein